MPVWMVALKWSARAGLCALIRATAAQMARVMFTRAIRTAVARIRAHSPALADHLNATIHTGTFCSYTPDPRAPITWRT